MFALSESKNTSTRLWLARVRAIVTGLLFFFPAFLISLFVTIPWASHHWAGEAQTSLGAFGPSFWIGIAAALVCTVYLLRKVNLP